MSDDIYDMTERAHDAEIREARLRIEVDRLKAENERLREALRKYRAPDNDAWAPQEKP